MSKLRAKQPDEVKPSKIKMMIFGPSGVGKTWLSLAFPKPYYIAPENGADRAQYRARLKEVGGVYMGPEEGATSFSTVLDEIKTLATEKHEYKTLIVDSITKLYQVCIADEAEKLGSKDAFGASKKPAIANMRRLVNWVQKLDMNVLFVAHEITEWGNDEKGNRTEIGKIPDVWDKLIYELDLTIHAKKFGPNRNAIVTKSRLEGFLDGSSFPLTYEEFGKRYDKTIIESASVPVALATTAQVSRVKELLEIIKIDEKEIDTWNSKAGAESFEEYSSEYIAKTIAFLEKKIK